MCNFKCKIGYYFLIIIYESQVYLNQDFVRLKPRVFLFTASSKSGQGLTFGDRQLLGIANTYYELNGSSLKFENY